jgi:hypothetical protein
MQENKMKRLLLSGLAVLALGGVTPAVAQYAQGNAQYRGNWDGQSFWRDASADPRDRIQFLQRRIDRGVADGSLTRREARRSQRELDGIRRDARRMGRHLNDRERATLQARLDDVARDIRWQRHDNDRAGSDYDRGGPDYDRRFATDYDASRYYRDDPRYQERRLSAQDEVYRGSDGRYYCKRNDGTTGLIVGAAGGGVLGNVIDGGHNRVAGTLIGGALGALLGKSIDQNSQNSDIRCR